MNREEYDNEWEDISSKFFIMLEEDNFEYIVKFMINLVLSKLEEAISYKKIALDVANTYQSLWYLDDDELKDKLYNDYGLEDE